MRYRFWKFWQFNALDIGLWREFTGVLVRHIFVTLGTPGITCLQLIELLGTLKIFSGVQLPMYVEYSIPVPCISPEECSEV